MDPVSLAATVVGSFLVPFLKEGANRLGQALSGEADASTADQLVETADTLWGRIKATFSGPEDKKALDLFEQYPEDLQRRVESMLQERLETDRQLASELEGLVTQPTPGGASTGAQIMKAHYAAIIDNRNARISGGTFIGTNAAGVPRTNPRPPEDSQ